MRHTTRLLTIATTILLFVSSSGLAAPPVPARSDWSVVDRQPPTTELIVRLTGGEEIRGTLARVTTEDLTLTTSEGERGVPKSAVQEVTTAARGRDSVRNGMAAGAALGAVVGAVAVAIAYRACGEGCEAPSMGGPLAIGLAVGIGGGLGVGALVDRAQTAPLVLYRAARAK
jgi:hypothetical protein